jgi:phosphate transport system protein
METRFSSGLEELEMTILQMAALAEKALEKSTKALLERNDDLAREVLEEDRQIDMLELEVDRNSLKLLALGQPLARDLRFIIGALRIAVELERIGDQAANIARRAVSLNSGPPLPRNSALEELADTALDMLHRVISSFVNQDPHIATEVCKMDDVADGLHSRILKDALAYMSKEAPAVERSVQTINAAKCLERTADQTTNIAESVIFIVEGVNIKHHCHNSDQARGDRNG